MDADYAGRLSDALPLQWDDPIAGSDFIPLSGTKGVAWNA